MIKPLLLYEINTRIHCNRFEEVSETELRDLRALGFDAIWLMGAWQISEGARKLSKIVSPDFEGSPFAIPSYDFNPELGGLQSYLPLFERARAAGLRVFLDFVSNHLSLDSPWIDEHPEFFIRSDTALRKQSTADFFLHKSGEVIAFGRDPYFPPWHDTAQLDYTCAALRARMIDVLKQISGWADGVRCDMAMLVLRDQIRTMWYPGATERVFTQAMPREFWDEAIREVKSARPDFKFLAEAYWNKEPRLIELGFDLAYDKEMYDALVARDASRIRARLNRPSATLSRSMYFIENHDEARAASVFDRTENLAAVAFLRSLPGSVLINEGQMEARKIKLAVQRTALPPEPLDATLHVEYERIFQATSAGVFQTGELHLFDCGEPAVVSLLRHDGGRVVAYFGLLGLANRPYQSLILDLSPLAGVLTARAAVSASTGSAETGSTAAGAEATGFAASGSAAKLRLANLLTQREAIIDRDGQGRWLLPVNALIDDDARFCLVEAVH